MAINTVQSLANAPKIEGEFRSIQAELLKTEELIARVKEARLGANDLGFKDVAEAQAKYNKSQIDAAKATETLVKAQIQEENLAKARASRLLAEEKLRKAEADAVDKEAAAIARKAAADEKEAAALEKKAQAEAKAKALSGNNNVNAGVGQIAEEDITAIRNSAIKNKPIPFTVNQGPADSEAHLERTGTTVNETNLNEAAITNEANARKTNAVAIQEESAAKEKNAAATEENSAAEAALTGEYELQLTPLELAITKRDKLIKSNESLKKNQEEDKELLKAGTIDRIEYNKRMAESSAQVEINKTKIQSLNKEVKNEAILQDIANNYNVSANNTLEQLNAKLAITTLRYSKLTAEQKKGLQGQIITSEAKAIALQIDQQQKAIGNYTKNVGNYASGAYAGIRKIAQILPGIGIAGIFGLIFEGVASLLSSLKIFTGEAERTKTSIDGLTGVSKEAKDALKGMGETVSEIAEKSLKDLQSAVKKVNDELGLTPTVIENAQNTLKLLREEQDKYSTTIKNAKVADIFNPYQAGSDIRAITKIKGVTKAIDEQTKALNELQNKLATKEVIDFSKAMETADANLLKFQQTQNDTELGDAATLYARKRDLLKQNYDIQRSLTLKAYQDDIAAAVGSYAKEEAANRKFELAKQEDKVKFLRQDFLNERDNEERIRKATYDIRTLALKDEVDRNKAAAENESKTLPEIRIQSLRRYLEAQADIIDENEANEKAKLGLNSKEKLAIEEKYQAQRADLALAGGKQYLKIMVEASNEVSAADKLRAALEESDKKNRTGNGTLDNSNSSPFIQKDSALLRENLDYYERLNDAFGELNRQGDKFGLFITKFYKLGKNQSSEDYLKEIQKIKDAVKSLGTEVAGAIGDIFTNKFERQKNAIQDVIDKLDEQKAKDIEVAESGAGTEEEKAARVTAINAKADAQKTLLEKKQRDLDVRKAQFEKASAIASIILNTAIAVTSALTSKPPNLILAAIVGATGIIQAARAAAAPIPKYKGGITTAAGHPGGLMEVGDGGVREGLLFPDGSVGVTPNTSTVMNAPKGTKVYSRYETLLAALANKSLSVNGSGKLVENDSTENFDKLARRFERAIKNQPQANFRNMARHSYMLQKGHLFRNYLDANL